jgi:hypothetical protein
MNNKIAYSIILFMSVWAGLYSQTRNDMLIFLERTAGGTAEENAFFDENIRMEVFAANYTVTDLKSESDYIIVPMVVQNKERDATTTRSLVLRLLRNDPDNTEVVQVGVAYDEMSETYEWNLYLIYQAMANVPLTKNSYLPPPYNYWRDKWLYLGIQGIYTPQFIIDSENEWWPTSPTSFTGALSLVVQFLNFMSLEVAGRPDIMYYEPENRDGGLRYGVAIPVSLRFIIKHGDSWMIEPYLGASFNIPFSDGFSVPWYTPLVGLQVGAKMGTLGAVFFTVEFDYDSEVSYRFGNSEHSGPRIQMMLGIGAKFGFFNRKVRAVEGSK